MAQRRSDDLNLSLTGSQISTISQRPGSSRPSSAQSQGRRAVTPSGIQAKQSQSEVAYGEDHSGKKGLKKDGSLSNRSIASSPGRVKSGRKPGKTGENAKQEEDAFLAFFENSTKPKIKQSLSNTKASSQPKKPSSNAVKVLWSEKPDVKLKKPAWMKKPVEDVPSARSDEPHNIFRSVAHLSSDEEEEDIDNLGNSLSESIHKLQNLQNQLSGVNKQNGSGTGDAAALNSYRSVSSVNSKTGNKLDGASSMPLGVSSTPRIPTPQRDGGDFTVGSPEQSELPKQSARNRADGAFSNPIANNFSQKNKSKTPVTSLHNSVQNIKNKTQINQLTKSISSKSKDDLQTTLNSITAAAITIQQWYRRIRIRRTAGAAAIRRFLAQKKEEITAKQQDELTTADMEEKRIEERKKNREEKAREARQQAIKDLQKKREERKAEVKKVAEEEIAFLQANGKIRKNPSNSSLISKKKNPSGKEKLVKEKEEPSTPSDTTPRPASARDESDEQVPEVAEKDETEPRASRSEANTHTTLDDLYNTLKKLEEEENFLTARSEKKPSWLDELEKSQDTEGSNLTTENLEKLNASKDRLRTSGLLTDDKLKSIINFLDEVQVTDRLSEIDSEISRMNEVLEKPALLVPSAEEVTQIENAQAAASEVTNHVLSQRLELEEKKRTVTMLQKALNQQRELTVRHARETEKEMKKRLDLQKDEYEEAIKRHLSFIDQLIDDKKNLTEKCEHLVTELRTVDKKYQEKIKGMEENHTIEMTKLKEVHSAAEKLRREKWIEDKTKKIKEMTVKGLEPEIQRLIAKHKADIKKIKQIHEAELLEADERAAQKYVKMTEELRTQLADEKEAACTREREMAKQRFEKQLQQEEEAFQQQRRRLYQEVQEEKDRVASSASRQRTELERLQRQLEENHRHALEAMKEELDKARQEQENRHQTEIKTLKEKLKIEKESWEENYMKRHETWLVQKERELRDQIKKERDKEIELVIERLEEDASTVREENERTTEQKIRRLREKFENESRELEQSERKAVQRFNEIKAKMTEFEGENERLKVVVRQKDQEILDIKKLLEKMNSERSHVSDIIRQEFADRIVTTDEENKRIKHEISELRARHRIELERVQQETEDLRKAKDEELEEIHKRVRQAMVKKEEVVNQLKEQFKAANKRADHLEGLLEQQRKQLLQKK